MLQAARLTRPRLPCATRLGGASQNQIVKEHKTVTSYNYPYLRIIVNGCERCFPPPPPHPALRRRPNCFPGKGLAASEKIAEWGKISAGFVSS